MKTYYRHRILTLTTAGGLLLAGCGLDSNTSETLAEHPGSDFLCLAEIPAAESVFRAEPEREPEASPAPTPIPSDDWARQMAQGLNLLTHGVVHWSSEYGDETQSLYDLESRQ